jgi:hypothetical protein
MTTSTVIPIDEYIKQASTPLQGYDFEHALETVEDHGEYDAAVASIQEMLESNGDATLGVEDTAMLVALHVAVYREHAIEALKDKIREIQART